MRKTLTMKKVKEIARLKALGLSQRQIARSLNISKGVVHKYLSKLEDKGLQWPLVEDEQSLQKAILSVQGKFVEPDYALIYQELKVKGVTLLLLHEEYKQTHPDRPYSYTQFCSLYRRWKKTQKLSLRQIHQGGDKLFIDYAGPKVTIVNPQTGESEQASLFIAVMGASQYTFAEATWDQSLENWLGSHVRAFQYFGGIPALLVPDNLKSGVSQACAYDPDINPAYAELAVHYDTAVMPARPYKPQDKAKVENGVLLVERWILARLRHQTFYSLAEVNQEIRRLLDHLNNKAFQKMPGSRLSVFEQLDKPALKPLPLKPYAYARFKRLRVNPDYHLEIDQHFYSVPYYYVGETVDIRLSAHVVEVYLKGVRIASHERKKVQGMTTLSEHQPPSHRHHQQWSVEASLKWALTIGPATHQLLSFLYTHKKHDQQKYRLFLGFAQLARYFSEKRLEQACQRANCLGVYCYKRLAESLKNKLDQEPLPNSQPIEIPPIPHGNIRGASYYGDNHHAH